MSGSEPKLFHKEELRYTDSDFLGAGAFGEVFRCQLGSTGEGAAVKVLNTPSRLKESEESGFMQEVRFLHQLTACPYVIRLLGFCMDRGHYAIVTEFVENGDLEDLLTNSTKREKHPIIKEWACRIGMGLDVARGMDFLHRQQPPIIHRDLKSANVLIDGNYRCKVIDFGLATTRSISKQSERSRSYRDPVGTLAFTAPELFRGDISQVKLEKTDIYSYSILLWQLKEMKKPFQGEIHPDVVRTNIIAGHRPTPLSNDGSPEGLTDLITRCWNSHPDVRLSFSESIRLLEWMSSSSACVRPGLAPRNDSDKQTESAVMKPLHTAACDETSTLKLDFYNIMIGNCKPGGRWEETLSTVELERLNPAKIVQLYKRCKGKGFATALKPYLIDFLKRRETFQTVLDMFVDALNEEEKSNELGRDSALPSILLELSPKDIFVALFEVTPEAAHSRLVALHATLKCGIPLVYVLQPSLRQSRTVVNFSALQEVLASPSYPLVVSCGSENAIGRGKSNLTGRLVGQLQTSSLSSDSFDIQTSGGIGTPTHSPSIDLVLDVKANWKGGLNFADVHGFTLEEDFCYALSTLCSVAALVLVHITTEDFDSSGALGDGLKGLILNCCSLHVCEAQVVFFVRDTDVSTRPDMVNSVMSFVRHSLTKLLPGRVADVVAVENLVTCRTDSQRQKTVVRVRDQLTPIFEKLRQKLPCFEAINEHYVSPLMPGQQEYRRQLGDLNDGFSRLGRQVCDILEKNMPADGRLADHIFPLTAIYASIASKRQREKKLYKSGEWRSKQVRSELANLAGDVRQLENQKYICSVSTPVQLFAALVKDELYCRIVEFQHYLEVWKAQYVNPLLVERRGLMDQLQSVGNASESAAESRQIDEREVVLKRKLDGVSVKVDQLDISVDSFWSELMEFCDLQEDETACDTLCKSCNLDPALAKRVYAQCVIEGYPMQLLRGNPLQMTANKFLRDVLTQLHTESKHNLVVVSVIGAQSSAKSTLLNYLFGCGFATRAGRCTKGLYASYVFVSDGRRLLILDSEGLLSLEGGGHVFDGQIAVMAMACSHVVIVNHKGEISSQMKELLEVCLYAMDYLEVADIRPEMMFVLRDQRDRDTRVQLDTLTLMKKLLKDAIGNSQVKLDDLVSLRKDAIFLLPSAFSEQKRDGRSVEWPSAVFADETFSLRQRMLSWAQEAQSAVTSLSHEDTSLIDWYNHACIVWDTLTKYGYTLLHCKAIYELRLHKERLI